MRAYCSVVVSLLGGFVKNLIKLYLTSFLFILASCSSNQKTDNVDGFKEIDFKENYKESMGGMTIKDKPKNRKIYYFEEKIHDKFNFEEKSLSLWRQVNPSFDYKELKTSTLKTDYWDRLIKIDYQVPADEFREVSTLFKIKNGVGSIYLVAKFSKNSPAKKNFRRE